MRVCTFIFREGEICARPSAGQESPGGARELFGTLASVRTPLPEGPFGVREMCLAAGGEACLPRRRGTESVRGAPPSRGCSLAPVFSRLTPPDLCETAELLKGSSAGRGAGVCLPLCSGVVESSRALEVRGDLGCCLLQGLSVS